MPKARAIDALFDELVHRLLHDGEPRRLLEFACDRVAALFDYPLVGLRSFAEDGGTEFAVVRGELAELCPHPEAPAPEWRACTLHGIAAAVAIPVRIGSRLSAVLHLFAHEPEAFGLATVANLAAIGRRMAVLVEIAEAQQRMRLLSAALASAANAVFITNAAGTILWANQAFEKMSGYRVAEAVGATPRLLKSGSHDDLFFARVWATIKAGNVWSGEVVERHRDGGRYVVLQTITPMLGDDGAISHFIAIHEDVSERKRLEEELRAARDRALDAARLRSAFLANMSHEVRTPMNGVLGMLELLGGTELDSEQRHYLEVARRSARTLLESLNEILDYSQIESVGVRLAPAETDLYALLDDVVETLAGPAGDKQVDLYYRLEPGTPTSVRLDPVRVRQVLTNLVGNALKFTGQGEVEVRVTLQGEALLFSVRHTGIGIPAEALGRIFEAFQQADLSTTRRFGGSGLGLAICRQLVERMGGRIGVESTPGQGSRFWFTVQVEAQPGPESAPPLAGVRALLAAESGAATDALAALAASLGISLERTDPAQLGAALAADADFGLLLGEQLPQAVPAALPFIEIAAHGRAPASAPLPSLHRPVSRRQLRDVVEAALGRHAPSIAAAPEGFAGRVLVVDDNPVGRQVASAMLGRLGVAHLLAEDGRAAAARAAEGGIDLVLMDCQMPELDGYQAAGLIRRMERERGGRRVPIVALTAHARADEAERCAAAEMDGYLGKPLQLEALRQLLVKFLLRGAEEGEEGVFAAGNIDPHAVGQLEALDPEDSVAIIDLFLLDTPARLVQLRQASAAADDAEIARLLHTVRGSSASLGAAELVRLCAAWEARLRAGRATEPAAADRLEEAFAAVRPELARLRSRLAEAVTG